MIIYKIVIFIYYFVNLSVVDPSTKAENNVINCTIPLPPDPCVQSNILKKNIKKEEVVNILKRKSRY